MGLTYRDAGVDIEAGESLVDRIRPLAAKTRIPEILGNVGGFAGLCRVPSDLEEPVLVSGTDGVGTKLRVAFLANKHDTVGIDLVAMCVNDVITVGARPLFFLDYFASGALNVDVAAEVIAGIARGCELAGCALLGGETAEMPGSYPDGEYDLAGFSVGVVERSRILDTSAVVRGDVLIGLPSSGLHANGFSLARRALFDVRGWSVDTPLDELGGKMLGEVLLEPTRIYARAVAAAMGAGSIHAMCHVTGGGIPGNLPRVFSAGLSAQIDPSAPPRLPIFDVVASAGVEEEEMRRAFNLGTGFIFAVAEESVDAVCEALRQADEAPFELGRVVEGDGDVRYRA